MLAISFHGPDPGATQAFPSQDQKCPMEGMKDIFEHIGGVPPRLRFDSMTTAAARALKAGERVLTDGFARSSSTAVSRLIFAIQFPATRIVEALVYHPPRCGTLIHITSLLPASNALTGLLLLLVLIVDRCTREQRLEDAA